MLGSTRNFSWREVSRAPSFFLFLLLFLISAVSLLHAPSFFLSIVLLFPILLSFSLAPLSLTLSRYFSYGWPVDVYSFAVVIWEILAGEKPFRGVSLLDLPDLVARRCQRPEIPSRTPQDLKLLMAAMWADNPETRPDFCRIQIALHRIRMHIPDLEKALPNSSKKSSSRVRNADGTQSDSGSKTSGSYGSFGSFGSDRPIVSKKGAAAVGHVHDDMFIYKSQ